MKKTVSTVVAVVLFGAVSTVVSAGDASTLVKEVAGEAGGIVVVAVKATGEVSSIDAARRKITLKLDDGKVKTVKLGKGAKYFREIKIGDKVDATYVDELVVSLIKGDSPSDTGEGQTVSLEPPATDPIRAETRILTARIDVLDPGRRIVTLITADGAVKTVKVGHNIRGLKEFRAGDAVVARIAEPVAIIVQKQSPHRIKKLAQLVIP
jgi:Cu/Ag efflux protein CusF